MRKISYFVIVAFIATIFAGASAAFAGPTKQDAEAFVLKAEAFYKANGKEKLLAELNNPKGQFVKGDLYVFIWTLNYSVMAHPTNHKLIGTDMTYLKDPDGTRFVYEGVELAKKKGSGWITYKWTNPVTNKVESKSSFVKKVDDMVLNCGIYNK